MVYIRYAVYRVLNHKIEVSSHLLSHTFDFISSLFVGFFVVSFWMFLFGKGRGGGVSMLVFVHSAFIWLLYCFKTNFYFIILCKTTSWIHLKWLIIVLHEFVFIRKCREVVHFLNLFLIVYTGCQSSVDQNYFRVICDDALTTY